MKLRSPFARIGNFVRISAVCSVGAVCVALALCSNASADFIPHAITGVVGSAGSNSDGPSYIQNVVNGDGLTVTNPLDSTTWTHDNNWQTGWQETFPQANVNTQWYTADLGAVHTGGLEAVIWNCREVFQRGAQDVNIFYSTSPLSGITNSSTTNYSVSDGWTSLGSFVLNEATNSGQYNSLIDLSGINARYIGFQITSNYGDGGRVGFSEIQFATPEPSSVVLLGLGALGLGAVARRRRKKA